MAEKTSKLDEKYVPSLNKLTINQLIYEEFNHPRHCVYLLEAEDNGLTKNAIDKSHHLVKFDTRLSVNVSFAGSIIMYNRNLKLRFGSL